MGYWSRSARPPVPGRKRIARLLTLWIALAVLLLAFGQLTGSLYVLFLGPIPFLFVPSLLPADPLARAVAKLTASTVIAFLFSGASLFLFAVLCVTAFAYLSGAPLPELITRWDRKTLMTPEASLLMSVAFANGFSGMSLIGTVFEPVRNWAERLPCFGKPFAGFARLAGLSSVQSGGYVFVASMVLYFWEGAQGLAEEILAGMFWPALALVLVALALSAACNGILWFYALPMRGLFAGKLVRRMFLR